MWQKSKDAVKNIENTGGQTANTIDENSSEVNKLDAEIQTTDTSTGVDAGTVY